MYILLWLIVAITPIICTQQNSHRLLFNFAEEIKFGYTNNLTESTTIIKDLEHVTALDYIHKDSLICWADDRREHIACIVQNEGHHGNKIIYVKNVISNAIACDWITRKIYWIDTTFRQIKVISLDTGHRAVVYWEDLNIPRGLVLDPLKGLIFWIDWDWRERTATIETGSMDGDALARKKIVGNNLIQPEAITLDIQRQQIYWTDERNRIVETADYNGGNRRIVINALVHPFTITLFQQKLYLIQYDKLSDNVTEPPTILFDSSFPMTDVKAYDVSLQPYKKTGCRINNGECAQLCLLSSTNQSGYSCNCRTDIKLLDDKRSCALHPEHLLLLAQRKALNITYPETAFSRKIPLKNVGNITHVDYDPVEQFIYWTDTDDGNIRRSKLDGSQQLEVINTGVQNPGGIAIDWLSQNIYWTDAALNTIEVYSLAKKVKKTVVFENIEKPKAIIVIPLDGLLFWSECNSEKPKIGRAELDGAEQLVLVHYDMGWPNALTADYVNDKIYWSDPKLGRIEVVNFEGQSRHVVVGVNLLHIFSLTYLDNKLYWTDSQLRSLKQISLFDPRKRRVSLAENITDIVAVKAFSTTKVIESRSPCTVNNGQCSQLCFTRYLDKYVCDCATDYILHSDNKTCIRLTEYIVLHSNDKIIRISTRLNKSQQAVPVHVNHVTAIDVDSDDGTLYWSDYKSEYISRSLLDGSSSKIILEGGLRSPESIAVDWISHNIYWADSILGRIEVVTHDGMFRRTLIWTNLKEPRYLLVDPTIGQLFFTEYDDIAWPLSTAWTISTAGMDGSNKKTLIQNIDRVTGMTVDYKQRLLYWINNVNYASRIETCNLDGKNRKIVHKNLGFENQYFLTLDKEFLYVGTPRSGIINRIHKSNYTRDRTISTNFKRSTGMKMVERYETIGRNNCSISNGGCQYLCLVKPGFSNGSTNTICACPTHYTNNGGNCNPPMDFVVVSQPSTLHRVSLNKDDCPDLPLPINGINDVTHVQYDAGSGYFFWVEKSQIVRSNFNKSLNILGHISEYMHIYDIALDPISKLLFWTCSARDVINVTKLTDSLSTMTIFKGNGVEKPRLIAIHPERGDIFWSDNGALPRIIHSKYNGSFLGKIDSDSKIVKAMFVDRRENTLYFSITDKIVRYNLNNKMRTAIKSSNNVNNVAKFVVLDKYLYWLNTAHWRIERALINNDGQLGEKTTVVEMYQATDLIAVTVEDDRNQRHPCSAKNNFGNCSHICTAVLFEPTLSECSCPLYSKLNDDKKTCSEVPLDEIFICVTGNEYISKKSICDGKNDCIDGSDESVALCTTSEENDITVYTSSTQRTFNVDGREKPRINYSRVIFFGMWLLFIPIIFYVRRYVYRVRNKLANGEDSSLRGTLAGYLITQLIRPTNVTRREGDSRPTNSTRREGHSRPRRSTRSRGCRSRTNASEMSSMIHCPLNPPPSPSTTFMRQDDCDCEYSYFQSSTKSTPCSTDVGDESDVTYLRNGSSSRRSSSSGGGRRSNVTPPKMSWYRRSVERSRRNRNPQYRNDIRRTILLKAPPAPAPSMCSSALYVEADLSDSATASATDLLICTNNLTVTWNAGKRNCSHLPTPPAPPPSAYSSVPPSPSPSPHPRLPTPDRSSPNN